MKRDDNSKFLLYIEPENSEKSEQPIDDDLTKLIEFALNNSITGAANYSELNGEPLHRKEGGWRGCHTVDCGKCSTNHDYLLENGLITNSLAVFYISNYRSSIKRNDWLKIEDLIDFYQKDIDISKYLIFLNK